jgi:hypothetical protein
MTTISMQPQQYVCKFIEAEVQHILKTESRKVNKAPLETDFCLANGIVDIIMLTDLEDHSQPMRHAYYAPLPIIVYFDQLSDISRNADGTIDQHLMITISIASKLLPEDKRCYRLPDSVVWPDTKVYPLDSQGIAIHPESTPWQDVKMHSSSQARNPIKLGHLKLTIPMESIYVKQRTVKHSNFFPAQDGNVSTLEEESFPYSMLMDFGPALSNESFGPPEQVQLDSSLNHMQRTRTQTREQLEAADNCRLVFSPPAGQSQPPVPPVSQAQPGHSSSEQGVPRSSPNTTNTSSGNTGSSPVQPRPVIGDIVVDLNVEQAPLGASEQRQLPPSTPTVPPPGPQPGSQQQISQEVEDRFAAEAGPYTDSAPQGQGITTRLQAASLNLTKSQLDYLLQLLTQMNTFKEQSVSAMWLDPLVTYISGNFVLNKEAATPANLEVVETLMTAESKGEKLTAMAAQTLQKWMNKNLRLRSNPETQVQAGKQTLNPQT